MKDYKTHTTFKNHDTSSHSDVTTIFGAIGIFVFSLAFYFLLSLLSK